MVVDVEQFGDRKNVAKTNAWVSASTETRSIVCSVGGLVTQAMWRRSIISLSNVGEMVGKSGVLVGSKTVET